MAWSAARRLESLKKEAGRQKLIRNMERFWGDAASGTCNPVRTGANQDRMMSQTILQHSGMKAGEVHRDIYHRGENKCQKIHISLYEDPECSAGTRDFSHISLR